MTLIPQKAMEAVDVPIINFRKLIEDRLNYGDCRAYVSKLIAKVSELSGGKNNAISTDVMELYRMINRQGRGGFFLNQTALWEGKKVSGLAEGNIPSGTAKITIDSKSGYRNNPRSISRLPSEYGISGIHEIIHLAGKSTTYSEELLGDAVRALEPGKYGAGATWDWYLQDHCLPPELRATPQ